MYQNNATFELVKSRYKDEKGNPLELTPGQLELFDIIAGKLYPRTHVISYTRYGKSLIAALGVLTRCSTYPEKWAIVAPSTKKAKIIMSYVIQHIFDNPYTSQKFEIGKDENRDKIRRERSKERINFRISENRLGEIFILSTEGRRTRDTMAALMGFGASGGIILDESSLIDDKPYTAVKRMVGDSLKYEDSFIMELGNPFKRNHFHRTSQDPDYYHIKIDWRQGVQEGRTDIKHINEMRRETDFGILYDCEFPLEDQIDDGGYMPLLTKMELENAIVDDVHHFGNSKVGVDVAGGGANFSVIVRRSEKFADVFLKSDSPDTTVIASQVLELQKSLEKPIELSIISAIRPRIEIDIDSIGVGQGCYDLLKSQTKNVIGVINGERASDSNKFYNKRAENYWRLREWILTGGKLKRHSGWNELLDIKWKFQSDKKIQIISKDDLRRQGIPSPDIADALANTFQTEDVVMAKMVPTSVFQTRRRKRESYI